jgi:beta-1,4-mannosyltransferase
MNGPVGSSSTATPGTKIRRLRVTQSFREGGKNTNPYLAQLGRAVATDADVAGFSWRHALTADYDVFHVHWPEVLIRGTTWWKTAARRLLFTMLMARIRRNRVALVRTLHNTAAHESGSRAEQRLLELCDSSTTLWIRLNPTTAPPTAAPVETILHGDYRDWFEASDRHKQVKGRILFFGLVRPYKGVQSLVSAFTELDDPTLSLHIVGKPNSTALEKQIREAAGDDQRVQFTFDYVDDHRLATEVSEAELVVLPYDDMHNSGALLLALSLDRPVLVPSNPITESLRLEVGETWITSYEGSLTSSVLVTTMTRRALPPPQTSPDLSNRSWTAIGGAHILAYRHAIELAKKSR